jgi:hypothetical protein
MTIDAVESLPVINCASLADWYLLLLINDDGCAATLLAINPSANKTNILEKCANKAKIQLMQIKKPTKYAGSINKIS